MKSVFFMGERLEPGKIICVGRNYLKHIEELHNEIPQNMVLFGKPNSCIGDNLISESGGEILHYEGEICFLVQGGRFAGVGFGLDLTRRELQAHLKSKGLPWERCKAFDGAAVFSEFVSIPEDLSELRLKLYINQNLVQEGGVSHMIYKPGDILKEVQSFSNLRDGDIVMTGTPSGVGTIKSGDVFRGEIYDRDKLLIHGEWQAH